MPIARLTTARAGARGAGPWLGGLLAKPRVDKMPPTAKSTHCLSEFPARTVTREHGGAGQ